MEDQHSPLPPKVSQPKTMTFIEALQQVIDGKKITKLEWNNTLITGELKDDTLKLKKEDGNYYDWIISYGDLTGTDWIVSPEIN